MEIENRCVNALRVLAMDTVHKANSGHSGAPLGLAPVAHTIWSKYLKFEPNWINRDRFVLSPGHASSLIYSLLHIHSRILSIDDLKQFRQYQSKTAGHPEHHLVPEIEVTTGPLGQGISNAVGLAVASLHVANRYNKPDCTIFDNRVFCIASDGDLMEGVQYEAVSYAGHNHLNNLIVFWDDNKITISGSTDIAFKEDVQMRFRACGWHTITVEDANTDLKAIEAAIDEALKVTDKPVLIDLHTTIGYGSELANSPKVHGTPLNKDQLAHLKEHFGFKPDEFFVVPQEVYEYYDKVRENTHSLVEKWNATYAEYAKKYPAEYAELQQLINGDFKLEDFKKFMPMNDDKNIATRVSSGQVLNVLAQNVPGLVGGSADLTPSNNTALNGQTTFKPGNYQGRYLEFGIREHAMQAIANGIAYYGFKGLVPFTATFFVFVQYLLPSLRVASLDHLRELLVLTHDSIGVGEDGATHQNVESFAAVRALPGALLMRPADMLEVSACYTAAMTGPSRPAVMALSRQNAPPIEGASFDGALRGGYVCKKVDSPKLVMVATGTEVDLALKAAKLLDFPVQVVSMPCMDIFNEQPLDYIRECFPKDVPVVSVEAGVSFGWSKYSHKHLGVETFGLSAPAAHVYKHFGLVPEVVAEKAKEVVEFYKTHPVPELIERP
ncbi:transketolase [Histomonas meleagridis]|uniref:transketolase n=1 Tax=Histomonas meleagridis TaxID=135588 RepID=UPI00355A06E4|nr:transketolase [Histomonas meleagridis]KAH0806016.1 transketolase [Histomonas meleagridis]